MKIEASGARVSLVVDCVLSMYKTLNSATHTQRTVALEFVFSCLFTPVISLVFHEAVESCSKPQNQKGKWTCCRHTVRHWRDTQISKLHFLMFPLYRARGRRSACLGPPGRLLTDTGHRMCGPVPMCVPMDRLCLRGCVCLHVEVRGQCRPSSSITLHLIF